MSLTTLKNRLKIKGHKFYLCPIALEKEFDINKPEMLLTKVKTKTRLHKILQSISFVNEIDSIYTHHAINYTVIVWGRK